MQHFLLKPVTLLWIDFSWIFFAGLVFILSGIFYFLNRRNPVNRAFSLLLLIIGYFSVVSILVISFRVIEAYWIILLMPVLCYLGFTFYLFIQAILGSPRLMGRRQWYFFGVGLAFSAYTAYMLAVPSARSYIQSTSFVIDHTVKREYTRDIFYILYIVYILAPIVYAAVQLVRALRNPRKEQADSIAIAKSIWVIFVMSMFLTFFFLSIEPIFGYKQSTTLGSFVLMGSVILYAWSLLRNRAWRIESLTERLLVRETQLRERNETIEKDLDFARIIHRSVLPTKLNSHEDFEMRAYYDPLEKVGGDFYDVVRLENKVRVMIADVSGHGVAAGIFSAMASVLLRALWEKPENSLPEIVSSLNDEIVRYSVKGAFLSALFIEFDLYSPAASAVSAGHPSFYSIRDGTVEKISAKGRLLGVMANSYYTPLSFSFSKGDTLVLYTDGIIEAVGKDNEEFGEERLKDILESSTGMTLVSRENALLGQLALFHGPRAHDDDITLVQIEKK